jgi:hypothetical protein
MVPVILVFATVAEIATLEEDVILPNVSTVKDGISVALPYVAADTPEVGNLAEFKVPVVKLVALEVEATVANSEPPAVEPSCTLIVLLLVLIDNSPAAPVKLLF